MKNLIHCISIFSFIVINLSQSISQERAYKISGHIEGAENEYVYLKNKPNGINSAFQIVTYDSCFTTDGGFEFTGIFNEPDFYSIELVENDWIPFWISEYVHITASKDSLYRTSTVTGSDEHDVYVKIHREIGNLFMKEYVETGRQFLKDESNLDLRHKLDSIESELGDYLLETISNSNGMVSPIFFVISNYRNISKATSQKIYERLSQGQRLSKYGKLLGNQLSVIQKGDTAIFFSQKDYKGNIVDLGEYKGKYILLDFWASWCIPCLEELPEIRMIADSYPEDKLVVIGVSLDTNRENWVKSIEENNMTWLNVSDLKGNLSDIGVRYGVVSIPYKVLISPEGFVIESTSTLDTIAERLKNNIK